MRNLVIVGGGTAGWMSAATLARFLHGPDAPRITLIESPEIGTVGVGEATIPPLLTWHNLLGIDEVDFLRNVKGTYKLGIQFVEWTRPGHTYFHPFGTFGLPIEYIPFHQHWSRARLAGDPHDISMYSLCTAAAAQNAAMARAADSNSVLSSLQHAYHLDAGLYAGYLRQYAVRRGVQHISENVVHIELHGETGEIVAVKLADGRRIAGDFFVDCSGFRGLLIEGALETGYERWSHWLPCDRAIAAPCALAGAFTPFTRSTARAAGWQWRIPLQHRLGNGYVYASSFTSDEEAQAVLLANLDGPATADPRLLKFVTGRRKKFWNKNCLAVGLAAGFMEPLESTSIHLVQTGISRLIAFFPDRRSMPAEEAAFNRVTIEEWENVRDFLILHYHAQSRQDPLWRAARDMSIPDTLRARIELFRSGGRIFRYQEELFGETSWIAVMLGQAIVPESYTIAADVLSLDALRRQLAGMREVIARAAHDMPKHQAYLQRIGAWSEDTPPTALGNGIATSSARTS